MARKAGGTLVLSAWEPEVAPLRRLGGGPPRRARGAAPGVGAVPRGGGPVAAAARAAAGAGVQFAGVLGVSNVVGPRAHLEWRANHLPASRAACHVVWSWLRATRG